jgi:hypothetical protein
MARRFVKVDQETPMRLPPDRCEWVPADDIVHFVIEAVAGMNLAMLKVNGRGGGAVAFGHINGGGRRNYPAAQSDGKGDKREQREPVSRMGVPIDPCISN